MKITRLKLVNFIGIKHGLGLDEIEIDFSKGSNKIIMLRGSNGSGKSTILSQLHPFKESFDDRKTLILDGKEGLKEIDIESCGHKYEIVHTYGKTPQSFIKKDGEELNENGGVRTFDDIIFKELGLTKDYFKIGKIGSNTQNFVDLSATARKSYISTFLNIEDMEEGYKNANDKLRALNKQKDNISENLKKYPDPEVVKTQISQLTKSIGETDIELSKKYTEQGSLGNSLGTILDNIKKIHGGNIMEATNATNTAMAKTKDAKNTKESLEKSLDDISNVEKHIDDLTQKVNELNTEVSVNKTEQSNKNLALLDERNKQDSINIEIEGLGDPDALEKIEKEIEKLTKENETLKSNIQSNPCGMLIFKNRSKYDKNIEKFKNFTDFIEKYYTDLSKSTINPTRLNIDYFFDDDFKASLTRQIKEVNDLIDTKQKMLEEKQKERGINEGFVSQLASLNKRPKNCKIDTCPFIEEALKHKDVKNEIAAQDLEILQLKKDIEILDTKSDNMVALKSLYDNFLIQYNNVDPRGNELYIEFLDNKSLQQWISGKLSEFQKARQNFIDNCDSAYSDMNTYLENTTKLNQLNTTKKSTEDKDSTVREKYEKDLEECKEKISKLTKERDELVDKGNELSEEYNTQKTLLDKYKNYSTINETIEELEELEKSANEDLTALKKLYSEKDNIETKLDTIKNEISVLTVQKTNDSNNLVKAQADLLRIQSLEKSLKSVMNEINPVKTVADALNPRSGIPLILIKNYLGETEKNTNELLKIAFGNDFKIKFVTTDKEFSIQVETKGDIKPDIKMASQGELSITTISICLALIEQSIGKYNILTLDEVDGPLDEHNRQYFIQLLESQINKLGIEQCFIISHNKSFDTAPVDLVLLPGNDVDTENSSYMDSKTILYDYNN